MNSLLLVAGLPALLGPLVAVNPPRQAVRIALLGVALSALSHVATTLDVHALRATASGMPFVAFTAGLGAAAAWGDRRALACHLPVAALLLFVGSVSPAHAFAGVVAGLVVLALLDHLSRRPAGTVALHPEPELTLPEMIALIVAIVMVRWIVPVSVAAVVAVLLWSWYVRGQGSPWRRAPVLPVIGVLVGGALAWLVTTIAGTPAVALGTLDRDAPLSAAAGVAIAGLGTVLVMLLGAPWPLDRFPRSAGALFVAAQLGTALADGVPDGVVHWIPLVGAWCAVGVVGGVVTRRPLGALAALVATGSLLGMAGWSGAIAVAAVASVLAVHPRVVRWPAGAGAATALTAAGGALVVHALLSHEVTWGVVTILGVMTGLARAAAAWRNMVAPA